MEQSFCVSLGGNSVGKVTVGRLGLYYQFVCRCRLSEDILYRLVVNCGSVRENLGILVPDHGWFTLNKKIPVKRIGEGDMSFHLVSRQEEYGTRFIPICPEEPFAYISRLKQSFLVRQNGLQGIRIAKKQE